MKGRSNRAVKSGSRKFLYPALCPCGCGDRDPRRGLQARRRSSDRIGILAAEPHQTFDHEMKLQQSWERTLSWEILSWFSLGIPKLVNFQLSAEVSPTAPQSAVLLAGAVIELEDEEVFKSICPKYGE